MAMRRLHQVAQRAVDLDRATAFYRDILGLAVLARFDPPGLAFFDLGDTRLLLEAGAPSAILYLEVDDIDATAASLAASGVEFVDEPHLDPPRRRGHVRCGRYRGVDDVLPRLGGEPARPRRTAGAVLTRVSPSPNPRP